MSWPIRFDKRLPADIAKAQNWYEQQQAGLGERFADAFYGAVESSARHPLACPLFKPFAARKLRYSFVPDFPYAFYFRIDEAEIFVFLLFHGARNPLQLHRMISRRSA